MLASSVLRHSRICIYFEIWTLHVYIQPSFATAPPVALDSFYIHICSPVVMPALLSTSEISVKLLEKRIVSRKSLHFFLKMNNHSERAFFF